MRWRVLVVVALLALSGCTTLTGSEDPVRTVTPAPVPTDVPDSGPGSMVAPGVHADGSLETESLLAAHRRALSDTSFAWAERENRTGRINTTTSSSISRKSVVFENASSYYFETNSRTSRYTGRRVFYPVYNEYANGDTVYVRSLAISWAEYRYDHAAADGSRLRFVRPTTTAVDRYLSVDSVSVERIESAEGPRFRLSSSSPSESLVASVEDYRVTAVVTPQGLVRNLTATYTTERSGGTGTISFTHRYTSRITAVGNVTVKQPDWLDDAKEAVSDGADATGP